MPYCFLVDFVAALSFEFAASHTEIIDVMPRLRRETGVNDTLIVAVFFSFVVGSILVGGYIGRLVSDYFVGVPTTLLGIAVSGVIAATGWAYIGIPWVRRRQVDRLKRLCPETQTHISATDDGVTISDDLGSLFWRWSRIRRAVVVEQGVLIVSGTSGCLIPTRAFGGSDKQTLVDFINSRAGSSVTTNP